MRERIARGLAALGLATPPGAAEQLAEYGRLLMEGNERMNLTAITGPEEVADLHMLDCAALAGLVRMEGKSLIDVGTGAGFPGLVLKIIVPSLEVTLLDGLGKRLNWLEETIAALGLSGVRTVHDRGEEMARDPAFREQFDFAAARAVAGLPVLAELCLPFVRVGGQFLAMKSVDCGGELEQVRPALPGLGGGEAVCRDYAIPGTQVCHRLVVVGKTAPSGAQFPRRWAKMQKEAQKAEMGRK